jgi:hypothetical protein
VKAYPSQVTLSPEVTSKAAPNEEVTTPKKYKEDSIDVKTLTNELAAALLDISAKEDLVKQHSKVAEEAVSGIFTVNQIFIFYIFHVLHVLSQTLHSSISILYINEFSMIWWTSFSNQRAIYPMQL